MPMSFLMAVPVCDLARSSKSFPKEIKVMITVAASKYTCGWMPLACQNSGYTKLNTLKMKATPVLKATKVSILA